jgi:hypothetical protein
MAKTWTIELAVVSAALAVVFRISGGGSVELLGSLAVLAGFAHAQVSDRMAEREARRVNPDVHCWRWSRRYFVLKELLWLAYFVAHRSWAALAGVGIFLLYPAWRSWYRGRYWGALDRNIQKAIGPE